MERSDNKVTLDSQSEFTNIFDIFSVGFDVIESSPARQSSSSSSSATPEKDHVEKEKSIKAEGESGGSSRSEHERAVLAAVHGLIQSIALGTSDSLQDTLRLLTLWFKHTGMMT